MSQQLFPQCESKPLSGKHKGCKTNVWRGASGGEVQERGAWDYRQSRSKQCLQIKKQDRVLLTIVLSWQGATTKRLPVCEPPCMRPYFPWTLRHVAHRRHISADRPHVPSTFDPPRRLLSHHTAGRCDQMLSGKVLHYKLNILIQNPIQGRGVINKMHITFWQFEDSFCRIINSVTAILLHHPIS